MTAAITADGIVTVRVPMNFRKRGGRKLVMAPNGGSSWAPQRARVDSALVKALARAFRWRYLLESGAYSTVQEIAVAEGINPSYVSRVLRLTLLAPGIVEAILDGRQAESVTLERLMRPFPVEWEGQRQHWGVLRVLPDADTWLPIRMDPSTDRSRNRSRLRERGATSCPAVAPPGNARPC